MKFFIVAGIIAAAALGCQGRTVGVFDIPARDPAGHPVRATITDCGGTNALVKFTTVGLTPDPVKYPGSIGLNLDLTFNGDLPAGSSLDMSMTKLGLFPISLPCIDGLGACKFDICSTVEANQEVFCQLLPTDADGVCACPITAGSYISTGPVTMELPDFGSLIGSLLVGNYEGEITVLGPSNEQLGCLHLLFRMEK